MNDSRLKKVKGRGTPPTKLKPLNQTADFLFPQRGTAHSMLVWIDDTDEYYVGHLIGYTASRGMERGGYVIDDYPRKFGEGLTEWSYKAGEHLYSLHDRYNELLGFLNGEYDDDNTTPPGA